MNDFARHVAAARPELDAAYARVLASGWFVLGREVAAFEEEFATFLGLGARHAVGVGNGMDALEIALRALGIGPGEEVITTPNSAFATALAVLRAGAKPVFVDIEDGTYALDPARVEAAITPRTRALLPVHIYGQACDLNALGAICARHGLKLIGDAAQAHGAQHRGRDVATYGDATAYSFYPTKNLGCLGDGGLVTFASAEDAATARQLRDYGQSQKYVHTAQGLNSRLDELQAALLRAQLRHLPVQNARRAEIAARYEQTLSRLPVTLPARPTERTSVHHLFVIRTARRDALAAALKDNGVQSAVHYPMVLPQQPALRAFGHRRGEFPIAERCADEYLSLPIHPHLSDTEVDQVCAAVASALG